MAKLTYIGLSPSAAYLAIVFDMKNRRNTQ